MSNPRDTSTKILFSYTKPHILPKTRERAIVELEFAVTFDFWLLYEQRTGTGGVLREKEPAFRMDELGFAPKIKGEWWILIGQ